ncbi:MAG: glycosyl hydrolase [Candidatus Absconditicoccaceae bacterium]
MKLRVLIIFFFVYFILGVTSDVNAYIFGLKSSDNTIENIQQIEKKYKIRLPVVGFIFDPRGDNVLKTINSLGTGLGIDRVYHITISPNMFSAQEVADGKFDKEYISVFKAIKDNDLKVIFRTMHEMNGGRYARASNPQTFQQAWIHVWGLSRKIGLDQYNILFDFSINHRDMPTLQNPSQSAKLIQCSPGQKEKFKCHTFEDYYPGNDYVDIIGVSFYNRGKATSNRLRLSPSKTISDTSRNTLTRMKQYLKPIFIDEVGTTAVFYTGAYSNKKSKEIYEKDFYRKNLRLTQLKDFFLSEPLIYGAVYFNTDYTDGLHFPTVGEADWSIINLFRDKLYLGFRDLYNGSNNNFYKSDSIKLFQTFVYSLSGKTILLPSHYKKDFLATIKSFSSGSKNIGKIKSKVINIDIETIQDKKMKLIISKLQFLYK